MVKARIVFARIKREEYFDYENTRESIIIDNTMNETWEDITQEQFEFLKANLHKLKVEKDVFPILEYIESNIPETIEKLIAQIKEDELNRKKQQEAYEANRKAQEKKRLEKVLENKKKKLAKLKAELGE